MHERAHAPVDRARFSVRLANEAAILAMRLERLLADRSGGLTLAGPLNLRALAGQLTGGDAPASWEEDPRARATPGEIHPIDRLTRALSLLPYELDLVYLAGVNEAHEGFAALLRALHPLGEPRPTFALAAALFCRSEAERRALRARFHESMALRSGLLTLRGDGPLIERSLALPESLWSALNGEEAWPSGLSPYSGPIETEGLASWLGSSHGEAAARALLSNETMRVVVTAYNSEDAFHRALALVKEAGVEASGIVLSASSTPQIAQALSMHALARGTVLIVRDMTADRGGPRPDGNNAGLASFDGHLAPLVWCTTGESLGISTPHPVITVPAPPLLPHARSEVWAAALPELREAAVDLSIRYTLEPWAIRRAAEDTRMRARIEGRVPLAVDVADAVRARTGLGSSSVVKLVRPTAEWRELVLPHDRKAQLEEAVGRLKAQSRVLDTWGFMAGRPGARGVRILLSGPPGTGKTLSAEVIAHHLGVDLLIVDVSRVVSKWIGETEKNLSEVFDVAERSQCVLLFDEADALFGKRTEVSDAHDRYANLETAYLLSRLERFEGLTVLSTNLRQNVDAAFIRRLEFVVELPEPTVDQRVALWQTHLRAAPELDPAIDFMEISSLYPIVGATIRNAAVGAAYLAANDGACIRAHHLVWALRREYQKLGRAFPGLPASMAGHDFDALTERKTR